MGSLVRWFAAGVVAALAGLGPAMAADPVTGLVPASPQPDAAALAEGLAVTYLYHKFNHTREVNEWAKYRKGVAGEPIYALDYFVGADDVLTSDHDDLVGAIIEGLIRFDVAGTYVMAAKSNDGIELEIAGQRVLYDPDVHFDRFTDNVEVVIEQPGWYPLRLVYFEKKSTSTLEVYWQKPGESGSMDFVPPEAFAHLPGTRPGHKK